MIVVLGLLAGLHAASWGAYKDIPYEGFSAISYLRSILVAIALALALSWTSLADGASPVVVLGLVYALERLATEGWKSILREEDQSVYSIPMRFAVGGRTVDRRLPRYALGILVVLLGFVSVITVQTFQDHLDSMPPWLAVLTVGGVGGWATAIGGAWKDAPVEGFSGLKFLRSPVVATAWAAPLSLLTTNGVVLAVAAGGFAVATIETYKTFLTAGRPPGKFATKTVRDDQPAKRHLFVIVHVVLWSAFAFTLLLSLVGSTYALGWAWLPVIDIGLPGTIDIALATAAAVFAGLVAAQNPRPMRAGVPR